jgi:5-methylcytosine-specific restriction endonuclease McrA
MKYHQQLRTSAWMRKRAEIMQRDNFVCVNCLCDNFETPLEVHHIGYLKRKKAWEYPDYLLVTLCRDCHQAEHDNENIVRPHMIINWITRLLKK